MGGEVLGDRPRLPFPGGIELLEEAHHPLRVVTRLVHGLHAEIIRLALHLSAVVHPAGLAEEISGDLGKLAPLLPQDQAHDQAVPVLLRHLPGRVPGHYVVHLVGHHRREFGFAGSRLDQAGVHVGVPSGDGEGVDAVVLDHLEGEREILLAHAGEQFSPHAVNVCLHFRVLHDLVLLLYFHRELVAQLLFLGDRDQVEAPHGRLVDGTAGHEGKTHQDR